MATSSTPAESRLTLHQPENPTPSVTSATTAKPAMSLKEILILLNMGLLPFRWGAPGAGGAGAAGGGGPRKAGSSARAETGPGA
ncbi:MAG: hypothetical protein MZU95_13455 [Desulfomicrobium escambiense]|nr:hypothetical protein [Desulfomicrobium escambiense]